MKCGRRIHTDLSSLLIRFTGHLAGYRNHEGFWSLAFRDVHFYQLFEASRVVGWLSGENELRRQAGLDPLPGIADAAAIRAAKKKNKGEVFTFFFKDVPLVVGLSLEDR